MDNLTIPTHVAFIPDGNRRWAKQRILKPWEGHRFGIEKVEDLLEWCLETGIKEISLWVLSTENLKNRTKKEIDEIFRLMGIYTERWDNEDSRVYKLCVKYGVKIRYFGDLKKLPHGLVKKFESVMNRTKKYNKRFLNVLINYGGRYELVGAVNKFLKGKKKTRITENEIGKNLLIPEDVDLVIRTGGMHRLSNLMSWQTAYSEIYVTDVLWPDFNKEDLMKAIEWFSNVKRNFGR